MLRKRHITADSTGRSVRFLHAVADFVRWPFERVAWALERRLLWPLRERLAGFGVPGPAAGVAALAALAVAAVAVGVLWPSGRASSEAVPTAPARVALATPTAESTTESPQGHVLRGAAPSFGVGKGVGVSKPKDEAPSEAGEETATPATAEGSEDPQPESSAAATSSSSEPVPAGPVAMKVARRFAGAFVFYEIGEREARAKAVFGETASPELATALTERPPRLPEGAKVPKARVVNLVPGPRLGKAYTVSVSLLRVGLTSELRLEMEKTKGAWIVTDVRG